MTTMTTRLAAPMYDVDRGAAIWREITGDTLASRGARAALLMLRHQRAAMTWEDWRRAVVGQVVAQSPRRHPLNGRRACEALDAMRADLEAQRAAARAELAERAAKLATVDDLGIPTEVLERIRVRDVDRCRFCARVVVWDDDRPKYPLKPGAFAILVADREPCEDTVGVACVSCATSWRDTPPWSAWGTGPVLPPWSARKYAHELFPHPGEWETQQVEDAVRYHFARALGFEVWLLDDRESADPEWGRRISDMCVQRELAFLYDAVGRGLTGQEAVDWAQEHSAEESGELVHERAIAVGVDPDLILPYPWRDQAKTKADQ